MKFFVNHTPSLASPSVIGPVCRREHTRRRRITAGITVAVLLAFVLPALGQVPSEFRTAPRSLVTGKVDRTKLVPTTGALSRTASNYEDVGRVAATLPVEHVQLLLRRPAERQAAFDAFAESLHTKGSPNFHRWLTPEIVGSEFGPSESDLATVRSYLESEGFTVNYFGKGGFYVDFTGTAAQIERSFNTEIHHFKLPNGELKFAPVRQASIPEALVPLVAGFVSLTDIHTAVMNHEKRIQPAVLPSGANPQAGEVANDDPVIKGTTYYAVGPQDFYKIYNENSLLTPTGAGLGVTIALLEESDIVVSDVTTFRSTFAVTPALNTTNTTTSPYLQVQHGFGSQTCTDPGVLASSDEGEAILDTEWAGSVAPGANLLFESCKKGADLGVVYAAQAVVDNNLADILSLSYGDFEGDTTYGNVDTLIANLWEQAASQGETVVVSAGDAGAAIEDYLLGNPYAYAAGPTANLYASTAWNVSAGGTDFDDSYNGAMGDTGFGISTYWAATDGTGKGSALSYIPESPWNNSCASPIYNAYEEGLLTTPAQGLLATPTSYCGSIAYKARTPADVNTVAGGGGPSLERARPSWQGAGAVFGIPAATGSNNFRLQPDVSLFAANGLWGHFLEFYQADAGGIGYAGGTSFVAPQLAGMFAVIKQSTGERLGQPNYVLYDIAATEYGTTTATGACNGSGASGDGLTTSTPSSSCIFYDVQVGSNAVACGSNTGRASGTFYNCDRTSAASAYGILDNTGTDYTNNNPSPSVAAFYTGTGYDMATGLGSVNIANLVSNWQNTTTSVLFTPVVVLTPASTTYTYGAPSAITYTAVVSGPASFPTGSVTFAGTPTIGAIGSADTLVPSAACATGGACSESTTQSYTPSSTAVSAGMYTITAAYSTTNENYTTGSGTATIIVNKQLPGLSVTVPTATVPYGTASVVITAKLTFTGSGFAPVTSGLVTFTVGSLGTVTATCTGTTSPITCSYTFPLSGVSSGVYTITAAYGGDTNYSNVTASGSLTYGNASAIAGFTVANPQHTMYPTVTVPAATSNSNGAITYSVANGPATYKGIIGGKPTFLITGVGSVTIKASQAAATSPQTYTPTYLTTTFMVVAGSIWIGDTSNAVSTFDLLGNAIAGSGSGLTGGGIAAIGSPLAEAFDASGYLWVASSAGITEFSFPNPTVVNATPNTSGGVSSPTSLAIDGKSQIWVANSNGTISALTDAGTAISPGTGYTYSTVSSPTGSVTIDLSGNVWVTNTADNSVTKVVGAAAPIAPPSTALSNGTTGALP